MKVVFDNGAFTMQNRGGVSRYFFELACGLPELGVESVVYGSINRNIFFESLPSKMKSGVFCSKFPPKTTRIINALSTRHSLWQCSRAASNVLHLSYFNFPKKAIRSPVIVTVHDMIHEKFPDYFSRSDKTTEKKRFAVNNADAVIAVSESTKRDLMDIYGLNESKVTVVHHGVPSRANKRWNNHGKYILYVGTRVAHKNFERFLVAYAKGAVSKKFGLVCVGGGPFTTSEGSLIAKLGIESKVSQEAVSDAELLRRYQHAACFVYPSEYEGFGLPILEAMSVGCPVVCSDSSSLPEVAGDAAMYFDPNDTNSISKALDSVVFDPDLQGYYSKAGLERSSDFSWLACCQQTKTVYQSVLT